MKEQEKETKPKSTLILFFSPFILKKKNKQTKILNEVKSIDQGNFLIIKVIFH